MFVTPQDVRDYLGTQADAGKWVDSVVQAAIDSAILDLEKHTSRRFTKLAATLTFSSEGRASMVIPDLQQAVSVKRDGTELTENSDYWLLPSRTERLIFTTLQFRHYNTAAGWRTRSADWFDKGYDLPGAYDYGGVPNDIEVDGLWGWNDPLADSPPDPAPLLPADALFAIKVLAAWYVLRPDSVLGNVSVTAEGAIRSYENLPIEVRSFIDAWRSGEQAVLI